MKTEKQYVKEGGCMCPVCGSGDIGGGLIEKDGVYYFQEMLCNNCEASWNDALKLVGISNPQMGKAVVDIKIGDTTYKKGEVLSYGVDDVPDWFLLNINGCPDSDQLYLEDQRGYRYKRELPDQYAYAKFVKI